jgi:hypothetical protein
MVNELLGLAERPVTGSAVAQSYGLVQYVPFTEQSAEVPFSLKYGPLYEEEDPSVTTNVALPGISKYLLKSYPIVCAIVSGLGVGGVRRLRPVYTATLPGGIATRLPLPSTPTAAILDPVNEGVVELSLLNLTPETLATPESI